MAAKQDAACFISSGVRRRLWVSSAWLILSAPALSARSPAISIEESYADFLDAHGAVQAIEAGVLPEVDGHDLSHWREQQTQLRESLVRDFNKLQDKHPVKSPDRALDSMRRSFEEMTGDEGDSTVVSAHCADTADSSIGTARLSAALYACFESPGNHVDFERGQTTRVTALQLMQELDEPARREALFRAMEPLWRAVNGANEPDSPYRRLMRSSAAGYARGRSPVHEAAESFGISTAQARKWLTRILEAWAAANRGAAPVEPWDFRYLHSSASRTLSASIPKQALLPLQRRFFADLGADPQRLGILFDIEPRPGKAPLAYSDTVRIGRQISGHWRPAQVWVSANDDRGGLGVLNELVHETGHAVHFLAIRARPAFFWPDTTFIEAFADVPSWSVFTPEWQRRYLGKAASRADGLREQYAGVMLDVAWGLFEIRMLEDPATDPNELWSGITRRYLNIVPHPELSWWAVRSQLVTDPGYMVHYGLGAVITAEIRARTLAAIGGFDAGNLRWYPWLSSHLLASGNAEPARARLEAFLGHAPSPEALIRGIVGISRGPAP